MPAGIHLAPADRPAGPARRSRAAGRAGRPAPPHRHGQGRTALARRGRRRGGTARARQYRDVAARLAGAAPSGLRKMGGARRRAHAAHAGAPAHLAAGRGFPACCPGWRQRT
ncbi:MAG: hypothetical protein M5R42_18225 [Rhodocyclaceae bacterium]|nr:hypothetical protein [Rhodocyclaceae bacterium]